VFGHASHIGRARVRRNRSAACGVNAWSQKIRNAQATTIFCGLAANIAIKLGAGYLVRSGRRIDGFKDGGFKARFAIAWFTPILFLLIDLVTLGADLASTSRTILVVQVGSRPYCSQRFDSLDIP
jgi:hypothetical protein